MSFGRMTSMTVRTFTEIFEKYLAGTEPKNYYPFYDSASCCHEACNKISAIKRAGYETVNPTTTPNQFPPDRRYHGRQFSLSPRRRTNTDQLVRS